MKKITVILGSVTYAMKARKLLLRYGISSEIVKIEENIRSNGCSHGVRFKESEMFTVAAALRENGILYTVYTE